MAVLAMILPVVSRSSRLAHGLYRIGAESQDDAKDFIMIASAINELASILKQVGTTIKEDDRLPSHEAIEALEDIVEQSQAVLADVEFIASMRDDLQHERNDSTRSKSENSQENSNVARLAYLATHIRALQTTLAVLLQTLYAAQSIIWSKLRPTISPQQAATAVANERIQLEALIIEQQMSLLTCSIVFEETSQTDTRLLMEADSTQSLVVIQREKTLNPRSLFRYQAGYLGNLGAPGMMESEQLQAACSTASSQSERLLERWTSLPRFDDRLRDAEREIQKQKQENQQATVESDSEDEHDLRTRLAGNGAGMAPQWPESTQPLLSNVHSPPIPVPEKKFGPAAPLSPAASPRNSRNSLSAPPNEPFSPVSPGSSIGSLPVEAAAAIEAKEEDDDLDLEIPWTLRTPRYYWQYIDAKEVGSNTDHPALIAYQDRLSCTVITASWVCKEAIQEAGLEFKQVRKGERDGRRTKLEPYFCIEKALQFNQVKSLVERTVELYRMAVPPTLLPQPRRASFQRPPPLESSSLKASGPDRDRTPIARKTHVPLERSVSSMPANSYPPPPPLDRSLSMPGPGLRPPPLQQQQQQHVNTIPHVPSLQIPMPQGSYPPPLPPRAQSPGVAPYPQAGPCSPQQTMGHGFQQFTYAPNQQNNYPNWHSVSLPVQPHFQAAYSGPQSPLRHSYLNAPVSSRYDDTTTSDSESGERERSRRHRSKSRSRYASGKKKKSHGTSKAVGTLMGVGGLTALLDGLSGL